MALASGLVKVRSGSTKVFVSVLEFLAGVVGRFQRQPHARPRPDVLGQVAGGLCRRALCVPWRGSVSFISGSLVKRPRIACRRFLERELGLGRRRAVIVLDLIGEFQCAVDGALGFAGKADHRRLVRRHRKRPCRQFLPARLQRQRPVGRQLAEELSHRRNACGGRRLGRVACRAFGRHVARRAGAVGEDQRFLARSAGDAQGQVAVFRNGEGRRLLVDVGSEKDRRLARIGGRRHPGVDARRYGFEPGMRLEAVAEAAAERSEGESEGGRQKQRRGRAKSPRVALRDAGARQVAAKAAEACRHAPLVLAPERLGKRAFLAARPVGLHQHRRVRQFVRPLDASIDLDGRRFFVEAQRIERGKGCHAQRHDRRETRHVGHDPEHPQPGQAEKQADHDHKRQDQRPATLDHHGGADCKPRPGKTSCKAQIGVCRRYLRHQPFQHGRAMSRGPQDSKNNSKRGKGEAARQIVIAWTIPASPARNPVRSVRRTTIAAARYGNGRRRPALPAQASREL